MTKDIDYIAYTVEGDAVFLPSKDLHTAIQSTRTSLLRGYFIGAYCKDRERPDVENDLLYKEFEALSEFRTFVWRQMLDIKHNKLMDDSVRDY